MFYIKSLFLTNFRCYQEAKCEFSPNINIIEGNNAVGKTSLVESIYYLALGKSHKTSNEKEIIKKDTSFCLIKAEAISNDNSKLNIFFSTSDAGKKVKINEKNIKSLSEYIGTFRVVMFCPEDIYIIKGAPVDKRRFFDVNIGQINQTYLKNLINYKKILKQRNEILKEFGEKDKYDQKILDIATKELIKYGKNIVFYRQKFVEAINPILNVQNRMISNNDEKVIIEYLPSSNYENIEKDVIDRVLIDVAAKTTTIGPHRDDFVVTINGENISKFGSQGQQRTSALALKLAVAEMIKKINEKMVIILDDVFSELDDLRQQKIVESIKNDVQVFITTTSTTLLNNETLKKSRIIKIAKDGSING